MMKNSICTLLVATVALISGCASNGKKQENNPAPQSRPAATKQMAKKPTEESIAEGRKALYEDKFVSDAKSNRETGKKLEKEKTAAALVDNRGKRVTLADLQGQNVLLIFNRGYPGYVCPYCTTYTAQLSSNKDEFDKRKTKLVIVYPTKTGDEDAIKKFVASCDELLASAGEEGLEIPVYLDPGLNLVKQFNIEGALSKPSAFILDEAGVVRYVYIGQNRKDRPSFEVLLTELDRVVGNDKPPAPRAQ